MQKTMGSLDTVYAIHNFEAENDDELTFHIGETVIVIQKDDGFNDGWWKGENIRGEVGLFPMNYITYEPLQQQLFPTSSTSNTNKLSQYSLRHIDTTLSTTTIDEDESPSVRSTYSFTCPVTSTTGPSSTISNCSSFSHNNNVLRRSVINTLFLPTLRSSSPEDWDVHQVEIWLDAMNFGSVAYNFKLQEITGDILLELNMEALKELDVPTFGKRFKIHSAIMVLREECGYSVGSNRMSLTSSIYSDDPRFRHRQNSTNKSPTSRCSNSMYHRQFSTYQSNLLMEKHYCRRSYRIDTNQKEQRYEEEERASRSPIAMTPVLSSTSNYDMMQDKKFAISEPKTPDSKESINDMVFLQAQKCPTVLPIAHRSSMDIYSTRTTEDNGNVSPYMEGWLYKQGCKYKKWNKRWFVLKGPNLFYFKSPKDVRMKGIINLRGYRVIPDESIQPGKYSFKAQHEEERTFYFYTDLDTSMKVWISSLMKATISRDFTAPVLSSSVIPTVSLDVARRMRPRPPSVLLYRNENLKNNNLSPHSYEASYGSYSPISETILTSAKNISAPDDDELTNQDSGFESDYPQTVVKTGIEVEEYEEEEEEKEKDDMEPFKENKDGGHYEQEDEEEDEIMSTASWTTAEYVEWVNTICKKSAKISSLTELRQGEALIELLEELSGKKVKQLPPFTVGSISMLKLDNIVAAFKFMSVEGIEIEDKFAIKDVFRGKEDKIEVMLQSILDWSIQLNDEQ